jgi:hypothetical protein
MTHRHPARIARSVGAVLVYGVLILSYRASAAPFLLIATHPDAAAQPTATGQTLSTLKPFNGKLYAGFGDYDLNTGPIGIRAFDPGTGAFTPQRLSAQTEALLIYREIGGKLYAPHIDPWPSPPPSVEFGGYSLGVVNGATETWSDLRPIEGIHMFDMATSNGVDLWMVGSRLTANGSEGVAWRSSDGGGNWSVSLVVPPQRTNALNARLYAIHAYNGKLYTQGHDNGLGPHSTSKVFDGAAWSDGPSLGGGFTGNMWHPETFAGEMVYDRVHGGLPGRISKFNGTRTALAYPDANATFYDYTIDDGVLYALITDGRIVRTTDLLQWTLLDTAPAAGRSLGVLGDTLYVGGTGGQLWQYIPEPSATVSLAAIVLLSLRRGRADVSRTRLG